jgi:hypothetical protein
MRLRLDGHRMTPAEIVTLLDTMDWTDLNARFVAEGFALRPIRAPKRMRCGRLNFRLCWIRKDGALIETIRLSAIA